MSRNAGSPKPTKLAAAPLDPAELEADKCGGLHRRCAGNRLAKGDPASECVLVQPVLILDNHLANE